MHLTDREFYRALKSRDARFDGSFFVCVSSTGIYCRPVCPARTPRFENCSFVRSAASAEAAGYRPCLRCRPEAAPGSREWLGAEDTIRRALRLISATSDEEWSLETIAQTLGVSSRHLRRLFKTRLGASPKAVSQTERFATARQLLLETHVPIADVAHASGFGSVRRFNDATRKAFGMTPTELRKRSGRAMSNSRTSPMHYRFMLAYRPPYAWPEMLDYYRTRAVVGLEAVRGETYTRTVSVGGVPGVVELMPDVTRNCVITRFSLERPAPLAGAVRRVRELLDLDASPEDITGHLRKDTLLRRIVKRYPGLRIPGCWDVFEMLTRAIVGQQVSVKAATTVLGRLVEAHGRIIHLDDTGEDRSSPSMLFPDPSSLAGRDLRGIGLTQSRADTLARIAALFADDPQFVHTGMAIDLARERLLSIRGVGPWTAEYVALRALRDPDAFPAADLGVIKAAAMPNRAALVNRAEAWRPWRGYAVLYLWKTLN